MWWFPSHRSPWELRRPRVPPYGASLFFALRTYGYTLRTQAGYMISLSVPILFCQLRERLFPILNVSCAFFFCPDFREIIVSDLQPAYEVGVARLGVA